MTKTELEEIITKANDAYWNNNSTIISDEQYDQYVEMLKQVDPNNRLLEHIGGTRGKYRHNPPMLSLDKAYTSEDIIKWATGVSRSQDEMIFIQPKYDGIAGKIENDRITTRGDGVLGEDITSHKDLIGIEHISNDKSSPDGIIRRYEFYKYIKLVEVEQPVYGELVITNETFKDYFESGKILRADGSKYSNPRNAVAGLFNQKDITNIPNGIVTFVPYKNHSIGCRLYRLSSCIDSIISTIEQDFKSKYPMDGIVFKLHDEEYSASLGSTTHHPRGAIAYKFTNSGSIGIVSHVIWQSGKEALTPVLELEDPIRMNGSNIKRATCHNYKFFKELGLKKGQKVLIEKAGDVIPKIIKVVEDSDGEILEAPTGCPWCESELNVIGVELMCSNICCKAKIVPRLVYSAKVLNLDGYGPSTMAEFHNRFGIKHLYELIETNYWYQISHLPGFTDYSAEMLAKQLDLAIGNVTEAQILASLCIPGIGLTIARKLLSKYNYADLFISCDITQDEIAKVIGPTRSQWISEYYSKYADAFEKAYWYFKPVSVTEVDMHRDKVCFTGKFSIPRADCAVFVENNGLEFTDSMSADVKYLVVPDESAFNNPSSKIKYALSHKIAILTYLQFINMVNTKG